MIIRKKATATTRERDISMRRQKYDAVQVNKTIILPYEATGMVDSMASEGLRRNVQKYSRCRSSESCTAAMKQKN